MSLIHIIGAPQDLGQEKRGVDMGPSALRVAGLVSRLEELGCEVMDVGDILTRSREGRSPGDERVRFAREVVEDVERLADQVERAAQEGHFPLVLGGDHSIAIGSLAGLARVTPRQGLIWVDAHADFNTPETTPSGNIHGMGVAAIIGEGDTRLVEAGGVSPKALVTNTVLVGLRDVDSGEAERLRASQMSYFTMRQIDEQGIKAVTHQAIAIATAGDVGGVHLSFDTDAIDPRVAPGTGTPVLGALTYRESHLMMELLHDSGVITSADVVEVNPTLDENNKTAQLIVELISSLLGKRIL